MIRERRKDEENCIKKRFVFCDFYHIEPKIKTRMSVVNAGFSKKKTFLRQQVVLKFKEETGKMLQLGHGLCIAETWTFWKVDKKYLELLKYGAGEGCTSVGMIM